MKNTKKTAHGSWRKEHLSHILVGQLAKLLPLIMGQMKRIPHELMDLTGESSRMNEKVQTVFF